MRQTKDSDYVVDDKHDDNDINDYESGKNRKLSRRMTI